MKDYIDNLIISGHLTINNMSIHKDYLREAYRFAKDNSQDPETWTGALILADEVIIAKGANRFAPGIEKKEERLERPLKYNYILHAERDAIYRAASSGSKLKGTTMYMPWVPCCNCANAIITSGIDTLVSHYQKIIKTPQDWKDDVSLAVDMLLESGVKYTLVNEYIGNCEAKFRGEIWLP